MSSTISAQPFRSTLVHGHTEERGDQIDSSHCRNGQERIGAVTLTDVHDNAFEVLTYTDSFAFTETEANLCQELAASLPGSGHWECNGHCRIADASDRGQRTLHKKLSCCG